VVLYASYVCLLHFHFIENHPNDLETMDPSFLSWFCHNLLVDVIDGWEDLKEIFTDNFQDTYV
jgi:hypothetical protein